MQFVRLASRGVAFTVMICLAGLLSRPASATVVTINSLQYDLDQFAGAAVTTNVGTGDLHGSTFDNPNGIDGFTLGELATGQFGGDFGDRISLGEAPSAQDWLTLTYAGSGIAIGSGDASKFVVFEQSGRDYVDAEGQSFEISVNGGTYVGASSVAASATGGVVGAGGTEQNQIVFNLLDSLFGLNVGDLIKTVTIRNLGVAGSEDDPDFLFAARAGTVAAVPLPAALPLFGAGVGLLGVMGWRRRRQSSVHA